MAKIKILPTLTTTPGANWRQKIEEIKRLKLTEICLFPTFLKNAERQELYCALKSTPIKNIPFVHLRTGMDDQEIEHLIKRYHTKIFNIHAYPGHWPSCNLEKYRHQIYLENQHYLFSNKLLERVAGICLDFSHLEEDRILNSKNYQFFVKLLSKYPIGCGHLSEIRSTPTSDPDTGKPCLSLHRFSDLNEFNYILRYQRYLPPIIALELENSIPEQIKVKSHLEKILALKP